MSQSGPVELAVLDASGDPRVAELIARSEFKPSYHRVGPDMGQADAIAEGWDNTQGDVLAWLNADDLLMPGTLDRVRAALCDDEEIDVLYGDSIILDSHGAVIGFHGQVEDITERLLVSNTISQPSCFVRREAVSRIGGLNRGLHFSMDWELWVRLYKAGAKFHRLPDVLSAVYWGQGTKTSQLSFARIHELYKLVLSYGGPLSAARMLLGLAIGATKPSSVFHRWAKTRQPDPVESYGLLVAADRNPREQPSNRIEVPVINTKTSAVQELCVEFSSGAGRVLPSPSYQAELLAPGIWRVIASLAVEPAQSLNLILEPYGTLARLERIAWLSGSYG